MKMPNLDGQTLYESLTPARRALQDKFLFVTGDVLGTKTHAFLTKNRVPHVAKPFRVEELLEDAASRARVQMDRAELVLDDAMIRTQRTVASYWLLGSKFGSKSRPTTI